MCVCALIFYYKRLEEVNVLNALQFVDPPQSPDKSIQISTRMCIYNNLVDDI